MKRKIIVAAAALVVTAATPTMARQASRLGAAKPADAAVRQCRIDRRSIWQGELIMLENGGKPAVAH
jgi:hypothetical protein